MKLSVIIVNYNVEHFLEQCLHSVLKSLKGIDSEVFVVDNNSVDGSVEMVRNKFPLVNCISNRENAGFSKANNQAIRIAKGEYILLLNPDTLVEEDTFSKVISFMDSHNDAGGLGVKMLDGKGNFLPESKRGLPTPSVAFYKIFGLSALFPKSKKFGKYHLTYLDNNKTHEVDVLSGAFMLMRKTALDKVGLLDEEFFMYGEDIDLSYRIQKGGFKNYYFPETRIIHYKGESTKKSSVNYVFVFYKAMEIFARKHFSAQNARMFSFFINFAIYLRASLAIAYRFIKKMFLPVFEFSILFSGLLLLLNFYETKIKYGTEGIYSETLTQIAFSVYIFIWLFFVYLSGGYDKPLRFWRLWRGVIIGTGVILIFYALLPEEYRFSRALILIGTVWSLSALSLIRWVLYLMFPRKFQIGDSKELRIGILGTREEFNRVKLLLEQTQVKPGFIGYIAISEEPNKPENFLGDMHQLNELIHIASLNEIIFCSKDIPSAKIIDAMLTMVSSEISFKIAPPESFSIIGSNSIDTAGDLYVIDINAINKPHNVRKKRLLDILISVFLFLLWPITFFIFKKPLGVLKNSILILFGAKTWVGYSKRNYHDLPKIKESVLSCSDEKLDREKIKSSDWNYSRDYRSEKDLIIIRRAFSHLGDQ